MMFLTVVIVGFMLLIISIQILLLVVLNDLEILLKYFNLNKKPKNKKRKK